MILQKIRSKVGFTLIELLVCIVIIAIMASIFIPLLFSIVDKTEVESGQVEIVDQNNQPIDKTPKPQKGGGEKL